MDLRLTSAPLTSVKKQSVVSVEDVKAQARVTDDSEDSLIADYIDAAYDYLSGPHGWLNGYCLLEEQYDLYVPGIAMSGLDLPLRPLIGATPVTIAVRDAGGVYTTLAASLYSVAMRDSVARIARLGSAQWPGYSSDPHPATYRISVRAGHANGAAVPSPIRLAMKMLAAHWFQNREAVGPAGRMAGEAIPFGLQALCGRYRLAHDHS